MHKLEVYHVLRVGNRQTPQQSWVSGPLGPAARLPGAPHIQPSPGWGRGQSRGCSEAPPLTVLTDAELFLECQDSNSGTLFLSSKSQMNL